MTTKQSNGECSGDGFLSASDTMVRDTFPARLQVGELGTNVYLLKPGTSKSDLLLEFYVAKNSAGETGAKRPALFLGFDELPQFSFLVGMTTLIYEYFLSRDRQTRIRVCQSDYFPLDLHTANFAVTLKASQFMGEPDLEATFVRRTKDSVPMPGGGDYPDRLSLSAFFLMAFNSLIIFAQDRNAEHA